MVESALRYNLQQQGLPVVYLPFYAFCYSIYQVPTVAIICLELKLEGVLSKNAAVNYYTFVQVWMCLLEYSSTLIWVTVIEVVL